MTDFLELYKKELDGIATKVAMQTIRKILRDNKTNDQEKLDQVITVVNSYLNDAK